MQRGLEVDGVVGRGGLECVGLKEGVLDLLLVCRVFLGRAVRHTIDKTLARSVSDCERPQA